ncbi:MAG: hypothetical protein M1816_000326 [Peltula sp. TS41687]|nr:MAG: hypothetical protein M1816_000326 [Peltula sp. TS41687]
MSLQIATKANQALTLPALLTATLINRKTQATTITISYEDTDSFDPSDKSAVCALDTGHGQSVSGDSTIVQKLLDVFADQLPGKLSHLEDEWLARAPKYASPDFKSIETALHELDSHLILRSCLVGYHLSVADLSIWATLRGNRAAYGYIQKDHLVNVGRWFRFVEESKTWLSEVIENLNVQVKEHKAVKAREGASYEIALPDTDKGVVTRFPPEPSGYLHIGHAKAALLNDYFAHEKYKGKLILRFDDTNPSKEKEEFQDAIVEDLALMAITPDIKTHTSDYFEDLYNYCIQLIKDKNAYADDTDMLTMREQRGNGIPSQRRDRSVQENLDIFEEMKKGSEIGVKNCIRAKISVDNPNKAMRDPVIYRCNPIPHHRTGEKWKIYPTYDFACPVVDSIEGVTHALRTIEYRDRNPQYNWMLDALKLRRVHIWDFARMNFIRTVLSKRKLAKFVEDGIVWGWDDPRFPTVRGIRRRGMTIPALREFILRQGPSRNIVNLDWTIFWATNKKFIDPIAPRHTVVMTDKYVHADVSGGPETPFVADKPRHVKNPDLGTKKVAYSRNILLDQEDAQSFKQDEEITLMNWGNAIVRKITSSASDASQGHVTRLELELHLAGDVKKTDKKITWLAGEGGQNLIPVQLVDFDYLITKDKIEEGEDINAFLNPKTEFRSQGIADCNVENLKEDDIIQFERKGYYRVDRAYHNGSPAVLFNIPTGKMGK